MRYKAREDGDKATLAGDIEPVIRGLGFALVELDLYRTKKSARVRLVVTRPPDTPGNGDNNAGTTGIGTDDLARLHRAALPRLELALGGEARGDYDLYVEVSSPGTDRLVKEGAEFSHYLGRRIKVYLAGASGWTSGILREAGSETILLETGEGMREAAYEEIAKARLDG